MGNNGKRLRAAYEKFDSQAEHKLTDALKLVLDNKAVKFDETVELAINLGVDPQQSDQNVRGVVVLPNGTGKAVKVAVFAKEGKAEEAKEAGADFVGAEDLAEKVEAGEIEFDRCISTPDLMGIVGKLGKVLGPRGLMPNPKLGTVTPNVSDAVKAAKGGEIEFRSEKEGIVHAGIGKTSFSEEALLENINSFVSAIVGSRPSGVKGAFVESASLSSTMGPGIKLDLGSLDSLA